MLRAMYSAATGMIAQDKCLAVISNNIANVNTTGFKSQRAYFEDLFYETYLSKPEKIEDPAIIQIGHGTKLSSTARNFAQGEIQQTDAPLDLMIAGNGFFKVMLPDGDYAYTRDGSFRIDADGYIITPDGYKIEPEIVIPQETSEIKITKDGRVLIKTPEEKDFTEIGQLLLTKFINPQGLEAIGNNLFKSTINAGEPIEGIPGIEGFGTIEQGWLELSNVKIVDEMIHMILAQRAYELNSKVITTADQMFSIANRIR